MSTSTSYELSGRTDQKRRTRDALVAAARDLVALGETPTIEAAAEAASISRTTAYRYFANQRALLVAAHPETGAATLLPADAPDDDAEARLALVVDSFVATTIENEAQQRTMLRLSLEADPEERARLPLRQGRAIKWIEEALAPLGDDMSPTDIHRLAVAIRSATGIEAFVWLVDIAGLTRTDAVDLMRWSARALLRSAAAEHQATETRRRRSRSR